MQQIVAQDTSVSIGDITQAVLGHKLLVLVLAALGAGGGYGLATQVTDRYTSATTLMADASLTGILEPGEVDAAQVIDPSSTATVVETVKTYAILEAAVSALDPATTLTLRRDGGLIPQEPAAGEAPPPPVPPETALRQLVRYVSENLDVSNSGRSYAIYVRYTSTDPVVAAALANTVAEAYLAYRTDQQHDLYARWMKRLEVETGGLREELQGAERLAQEMREKVRLLSVRSGSLLGDQQNAVIAQNAELYASQREAERNAEVVAQVYTGLLKSQRDIQARLDWPLIDVRLFAPAVPPLKPDGPGVKPILVALGGLGGFLVGAWLAFRLRVRRARVERGRL